MSECHIKGCRNLETRCKDCQILISEDIFESERKDSFTCFYCSLYHDKVEAGGLWHCPNALCEGPGGSWFRKLLFSYCEVEYDKHTVRRKEWLKKGKEYNARNKIDRQDFF